MRIWIFADWNALSTAELTLIRWLKASDIVLGIMGESGTPSAFLTYLFVTNTETLKKLGIGVHHMYWLTRSQSRIEDVVDQVRAMSTRCSPDSILLDAEGPWHHKESLSPEKASELLFQGIRPVCKQVGLTGIAPKMEKSLLPLAEQADYFIPQAYSIWHPVAEQHWSKSNVTEPGKMQKEAHEHWGKVAGDRRLIMGLAAYWLERPGFTQARNMQVCLQETQSCGINEVAYWSLKHLMHPLSTEKRPETLWIGERASFIRGILRSTSSVPPPPEETRIKDEHFVSFIQWLLNKVGKNIKVDGIWGPQSQSVLDEYRLENDLGILPGTPPGIRDLSALVTQFGKENDQS